MAARQTVDERNSIVTLALHAYQELVERNFRFTLPADSKLFVESFALRGNVLGGFLEECCVCEPGLGYLTQNSMPLLPLFVSEMAWTVFLESNFTNCSPASLM